MSDASSATSTETPESSATGTQDKETVPKSDHQRALDDLKRFKKSASEAAKERDDLKTRLEALEHEKKTAAGDFKALYEQTKARLDETETREKRLKDSMVLTQKHSAVQSALTKAGLKPEFLPLLEKESFDEVVFEATSQGRFIISGTENFVENYKKKFPSAFESAKPPTFNGGGGGAGPTDTGEVTIDSLLALEKKCKASGDMKPYYEAYKKFAEKRRTKMNAS